MQYVMYLYESMHNKNVLISEYAALLANSYNFATSAGQYAR